MNNFDFVEYKGQKYKVLLEDGIAWYIDESGIKSNIGQIGSINSIEEAKRQVVFLLDNSGL